MRKYLVFVCGAAVIAVLAPFVSAVETPEERLWRYRNLGKAFYENPTTQTQAVDEFKKALDLAPNAKREQVNYALALLHAGKTKEAVALLEKVQKQFPDLPHTWFNLGIVFKKDGDFDQAQVQFERMVKLVPDEPISHYNLGVLYKQANRPEDAVVQLQTAVRLNGNLAAPHFQLYNLLRTMGKRDEATAELKLFQDLKKSQEGAAIPEDVEWSDYAEIYDPIDAKPEVLAPVTYEKLAPAAEAKGFVAIDSDVMVWGDSGVRLLKNGRQAVASGLESLKNVRAIVAGDYDNDGLMDAVAVTAEGAVLLHNKKGRFEIVALPGGAGDFRNAVWIDYDHDYDSDLILLGDHTVLLRNQGTAGFVDRTPDFPFVAGKATSGLQFRQVADTKGFDLLVTYEDHAGVLYHDLLAGKFEARPLAEIPAGVTLRAIADVNRDSFLDIALSNGTVLLNDHGKGFTAGGGSVAEEFRLANGQLEGMKLPANWIRVGLNGVKNMKLSQGAEVEVKTGALYQKKVYDGHSIVFDLGGRKEADTVRISWPNGLIQNEMKQTAGKAYVYKEAQRLSGSCPMIWTWNGTGFQFITDVLGVAPLGAMSGDGSFFPVDHDEYIQIPGEALKAVDGKYEIRITEELSEVSYLDQVQLMAVDHPANLEIFTNEKWKAPPFPEFRLYGVSRRAYPVTAKDGRGNDVRDKLLKQDFTYPDAFRRSESGIAELHHLDLDFGSGTAQDNRAVMMLHGWVDWADGSSFLSAAQETKEGLIPPYLQVKNAKGEWVTVIEDMGMPDGKPKTIAVDLTGRFLTAGNREVRIVTNMCVYWDEIFLSESSTAPRVRQTPLRNIDADVHFRGFSASKIHPERKQPETFYYEPHSELSYWNPTPSGKYTRYGDVRPLVQAADDQFVIMGAGDELRLHFAAQDLPPVASGWRRDFLLKVDGWAKDRDANTAYSQSTDPLPFHSMSSYPYPASEHYPDTEATREYRLMYNTRPALRLIRPLVGDVTRKIERERSPMGMGN